MPDDDPKAEDVGVSMESSKCNHSFKPVWEGSLQRICFTLHVKQDRIEEYRRRHASVWPSMLAALRDAGWRNYSLFLAPDGLLVGYLETEDFKLARERMKSTQVNKLWQEDMADFFEEIGPARADDSMIKLEEVFHLD